MPANRYPVTLSYRWSSNDDHRAVHQPVDRHHCSHSARAEFFPASYATPLTVRAGQWAISLRGPLADRGSAENLTARVARGAENPADLMTALARVAGSHIVEAGAAGITIIRGNLTGTVRISWVVDGDELLVSDRGDHLAHLVGDQPSTTGLSARLLEPLGHPADRLPLWERVRTVPPGHFLLWRPGEALKVLPWWTGHHAGRAPLAASVPAVRRALTDAVRDLMAARSDGAAPGSILADLSGGLDSSAVAALAATHAPGDVIGLTIGGLGLNTDEQWARLLSGHAPFRDHVVLPWQDQPLVFQSFAEGGAMTEEPCGAISSHAAIGQTAAWARARGATVHLTGHGGDHVFYGHPAALVDALPRHPVAAASALRSFAALFNWSARKAVRQLARPRGYRGWLAGATITSAPASLQDPLLDWGLPYSVPPWLTPGARHTLASTLRASGASSGPLASRRGAHAERDALQQGAALARGISQIAGFHGLPQHMPFFDDRVVLAAWSCRPVDRISPWEYKPLLKAAARTVLPPVLLERETKDEGSYEIDLGLRSHHADFQRLMAHSRLVELGVLDREAVKRGLSTASHPDLVDGAIIPVLAVESWLQARPQPSTVPHFGRHADLQRS